MLNTQNTDELDKFDHVVVLMLENRSFDNLLGYLYQDGLPASKSFAGLQDKLYTNPVPERALDLIDTKQSQRPAPLIILNLIPILVKNISM
ncbi:MAG: hypothetical protein IPN42_07380 [Methylococcaceae bacterium]|nr:hypothetical protein [Methylococcaceae bacterium]